MMRFATEADIPGIKTLWTMSFDDPINYVDFFYDKIAAPDDTVVFDDNGTVASMLTMVPTELVYRERAVKTAYIYGAATHKKYRARGLMTALLKFAEQRASEHGCGLCVLVPGEKYLFDYYGRRGYSADFRCRSVVIKHGMLERDDRQRERALVDALEPAELFRLREECLAGMAHIRWQPAQLRAALLDASAYSEHLMSYTGELGAAYAIYGEHRRDMYIRECLGTSEAAQRCLLSQLLEKRDPSSVTVQLPLRGELFQFEGETRLYGMAKPLSVNTNIHDIEAYMNLMFD